jgi:NADPH-dependent F420 reductase
VRVGILGGTGPLGRGLALRLAAAGARVTIGSRDTARAAKVSQELTSSWPSRSLSIDGAANAVAAEGEIVVAATPWEAAVATVNELSESLRGKVVLSVGNALVKQGREMHALVPPRGSVAATLQAALSGSLVAAACHHLPATTLEDLGMDLDYDVLVCSDHAEAAEATLTLLNSIEGLRPLYAGSLAQAAAIEAFTAVLVSLNMRYRAHSSLRLVGIDFAGDGNGVR